MRILRVSRSGSLPVRGAAVAVGNFDGVHLGHRRVVETARTLAERLGAPLGVVTFEPHPREVVSPADAPRRLTPFARKAALLRSLGVRLLFVLRFDRSLMGLAPAEFVERVLHRRLGARAVAVGENFRFGHRRSGTPAALAALARPLGMAVAVVERVTVEGAPCSSTRIRELLARGEIALANRLLGEPFELWGGVVRGDGLGRRLGFPTANLRPAGRRPVVPGAGIYVVRAAVRGGSGWRFHPAVASLGTRPAVGGGDFRIEVHLLDANPDLYGKRLRVVFLDRIREERDFPSLESLTRQMAEDCRRARTYFGLLGARG